MIPPGRGKRKVLVIRKFKISRKKWGTFLLFGARKIAAYRWKKVLT